MIQRMARLLVDAEWRAPEPVAVEGCGSGVNANDHGNESPEPQRSLFSWEEFMAGEPEQPKRRGHKPEPASISLFEWALEREREAEFAGAGR